MSTYEVKYQNKKNKKIEFNAIIIYMQLVKYQINYKNTI